MLYVCFKCKVDPVYSPLHLPRNDFSKVDLKSIFKIIMLYVQFLKDGRKKS